MLLLTAFFCVSLNLYVNSRKNLQAADDAFTTIGVMELYADVDEYGNLLQAPDDPSFQGHLATRVRGYDLSPITNAPEVLKYDLRARYGAYIPDHYATTSDYAPQNTAFNYDIIRFVYTGDEPLEILFLNDETASLPPFSEEEKKVKAEIGEENIHVVDSACGITYVDMQDGALPLRFIIWFYPSRANGQEARLRTETGIGDAPYYTLEPGTEYIGFVRLDIYGLTTTTGKVLFLENGQMLCNGPDFFEDQYGIDRSLSYSTESAEAAHADFAQDQPFWLYKYEDVLADEHLREYFERAWEAYEISSHSYAVMATGDAMGIPMFHLGNAFMLEGRMITQEEYASGAKVCMVSAKQANLQGWAIGDKLEMSFYEDDYMTGNLTRKFDSGMIPTYTKYTPGLFGGGEYEIVGIYDTRKLTGESSLTEETLNLPWNMLILPEASIEGAPAQAELPINGALFTLWLQNGTVNDFLADMEALGITEPKVGGYDAKFTFYDQGYSNVVPSLQALNSTSELLLILSGALLGIAAVLLGFFYVSGQRKNIGVMRLLGCTQKQAFTGAMQGALLCAGAGSILGTAVGLILTQALGASIFESTINNGGQFAAFSAFLAAGQQTQLDFATRASISLGLVALVAGLGLFLISAAIFMLHSVSRPPRALLAQEQK